MKYHSVIRKLPKLENKLKWLQISSFILLFIITMQSIALVLKKQEIRTILVPLHMKEAIWVSNSNVSNEYLEEMGLFFAQSFLNLTPSTSDNQLARLLKWAEPSAYGKLKRYFVELNDSYQHENMSTVFFAQESLGDSKNLTALIIGVLDTYVGDKKIISEKVKLKVQFSYATGQLLIHELEKVDESDN